MELMSDPVMVATGHSYDRSCIQKWLEQGNRTCPVTGLRLRHLELTPNIALRNAIQVRNSSSRRDAGLVRHCMELLCCTSTQLTPMNAPFALCRSGRRSIACSSAGQMQCSRPPSVWMSTTRETSCRCVVAYEAAVGKPLRLSSSSNIGPGLRAMQARCGWPAAAVDSRSGAATRVLT